MKLMEYLIWLLINVHKLKADIASITWRRTFVDRSALASETQKNFNMSSKSEFECAFRFFTFDWINLFCLEGDNCFFSDLMFLPSPKASDDQVKCMTRLLENNHCTLSDGTEIQHGTYGYEFLCNTYRCYGGVLQIEPIPTEYVTTCTEEDFSFEHDLGCVRHFGYELNWCDARKLCLNFGADLVSLNENIEPLKSFLRSKGVNEEVWVGLARKDSSEDFHFTLGGTVGEDSPLWAQLPDGAKFWQCAKASPNHGFRLFGTFCLEKTLTFVCEIPV